MTSNDWVVLEDADGSCWILEASAAGLLEVRRAAAALAQAAPSRRRLGSVLYAALVLAVALALAPAPLAVIAVATFAAAFAGVPIFSRASYGTWLPPQGALRRRGAVHVPEAGAAEVAGARLHSVPLVGLLAQEPDLELRSMLVWAWRLQQELSEAS